LDDCLNFHKMDGGLV